MSIKRASSPFSITALDTSCSHATMSSGLGDIANIVLKQMEIGDGPCKYLLQHREIVREPGQDTFTNVSILHAFIRRGKMFFSVEKNGYTFTFDDPDIAWNALVWSSTPENDQVSEIVHIDARVVTQAHIPPGQILAPENWLFYQTSLRWAMDDFCPWKSNSNAIEAKVHLNIYINMCKNACIPNPVPAKPCSEYPNID